MEHKEPEYHSSSEPKRRTALFLSWTDDITKRWTNKMEKRNTREEEKMKIYKKTSNSFPQMDGRYHKKWKKKHQKRRENIDL